MYIDSIILFIIFTILYMAFFFWYGGKSRPLTQTEVDAFIAEIQRASGKEAASEGSLLKQLRELCEGDDGREFYMVNLLKFNKNTTADSRNDPMDANSRYNRRILPIMLKYGGHPVFNGAVQNRFIHTDGDRDWDNLAMMRYRSRRDFLKGVINAARMNLESDKWTALEKTHVFPVKPIFHLNFIRMIVAGILTIIGFSIQFLVLG
jgi:hypothetical protein